MGKIEVIEKEVSQLSLSELSAFREWFFKFDAEAWDNQIGRDAPSGKLDSLAASALKDFQSGKSTEL
jgi:hypothetical protein